MSQCVALSRACVCRGFKNSYKIVVNSERKRKALSNERPLLLINCRIRCHVNSILRSWKANWYVYLVQKAYRVSRKRRLKQLSILNWCLCVPRIYTSFFTNDRNRRRFLKRGIWQTKSDDRVAHLNTILGRGGGNLNDPMFKNFTRPVCGFTSATFRYPAYIICVC